MTKNVLLALALAAIMLLGSALVRTENQRYALQGGMCIDPVLKIADLVCLKSVQTRTHWWWHLFYALTD